MSHLPGVCVFWGFGATLDKDAVKDAGLLNHDSCAASLCHQGGRHCHHHAIQGGHRPGDHSD